MDKNNQPILFSGIQPTGEIHIGNYLGALKNWVDLQNSDKYHCLYSVVDLHAITIDQDPKIYQEKVLNTAIDLLAIGIDPKKSTLFIQSQVPEHTELAWFFNTLIPVAELERMTQYKDKSRQNEKNINMGLFDYPVLMAADILLYKTAVVPVGEDQFQHLELTNLVVRKFNNKYGQYFNEVKTIVSPVPRLMSLTDPTKKMSKSHGPTSYIALMDSPEIIKNKIMKAVTDTGPTTSSEMAPGVKNLLKLLEIFGEKKIHQQFLNTYESKTIKYSELKSAVAEAIIKHLAPIQEKRKYYEKNKNKVEKILANGAKEAKKIAQKNILEIKKKMGLL
jgi:tryptophanyl-tRNA synthetase